MITRTSSLSSVAFAMLAATVAACAGPPPCAKEASTPTSASGHPESVDSPNSPMPAGDPDIVALARKVLACKNTPDCKEPEEWSWTSETWEGGVGDAALVTLLTDGDPKMRALAADQLHSLYFGKKIPKRRRGFPADKALGKRVIEALVPEQNEAAARALGRLMALINFNATGLGEEAWTAFAKASLPEGRVAFLEELGRQYGEDPRMVEKIQSAVSDSNASVRVASLDALDHGSKPASGVCEFWTKSLSSADSKVADRALDLLARRPCPGTGKVLDALEKKAKIDTYDLQAICERDDVSAADKNRSGAILKAHATKSGADAWDRSSALEAFMKCQPEEGRKLATTLTTDPDQDMQERAKAALSGN